MYKKDLALNDLQWLICHKTKPCQIELNLNLEMETAATFVRIIGNVYLFCLLVQRLKVAVILNFIRLNKLFENASFVKNIHIYYFENH